MFESDKETIGLLNNLIIMQVPTEKMRKILIICDDIFVINLTILFTFAS